MDKAHKKTDKKLSKLEKELLEVYKESYKNIDKEIRKILDNPKFKPGENNYILISKLKRFKELQTNIAKEISNINKNSVERIVELLDEVSEINYEFAREEIEIKVDNIKWGILNPKTYKEILKEQENPLFYLSIDDLKRLKPIIAKLDDKHKYEEVIYNAYLENNDFVLTDEQRQEAYRVYNKYRIK